MKIKFLIAVALFFLATGVALAAGASLDQCSDVSKGVHVPCTGSQWQNGNLNVNDSDYKEGDNNPYLAQLIGMTPGDSVSLLIQYAFTTQSHHAHDYLTTWDLSETGSLCSPQTQPCATTDFTTTWPIPIDPVLSTCGTPPGGVVQIPGQFFTGVNITLTGADYVGTHACEGTTIDVTIAVTFTVPTTITTGSGMLAWSGHIAKQTDWGLGRTATSLSGSPYHMRLLSWSYGQIGNQDRSMQLTNAPTAVRLTAFEGLPDALPERGRPLIVLGLLISSVIIIWAMRR